MLIQFYLFLFLVTFVYCNQTEPDSILNQDIAIKRWILVIILVIILIIFLITIFICYKKSKAKDNKLKKKQIRMIDVEQQNSNIKMPINETDTEIQNDGVKEDDTIPKIYLRRSVEEN